MVQPREIARTEFDNGTPAAMAVPSTVNAHKHSMSTSFANLYMTFPFHEQCRQMVSAARRLLYAYQPVLSSAA